jgi:hypothetical protein
MTLKTILDGVLFVAGPRQRHQGWSLNERSRLAELSDTLTAKTPGQQIAVDLRRTIRHFVPDLYDRLEAVIDPRKRGDYTMTEILLGGLFMFTCKQGSRNAMTLDRDGAIFSANYEKLFGKRLPHMDTVDDVLVVLSNDELERLKATLVATLVEKKVFGKFRLLGAYYRVAVDGTGVMTVHAGHCAHCLKKESKTGTITYFHNVLEAKLIAPNGFAISLATEWIENPEVYVKQDCELKAFRRLAEKLKRFFPRLPICIHADGLYPNRTFFDICAAHDWRFIVTLKDGNLKSVWEEVEMELLTSKNDRRITTRDQAEQRYRWLTGLPYQTFKLSWIECLETKDDQTGRFVFVTDLTVDSENIVELATSGRLRFKIENEGFNTLKNGGYGLEHKYSRTSYNGAKNYISLMHIAHLLNQLYELSSLFQPLLTANMTIKHLWKRLLSALAEVILNAAEVMCGDSSRFQIRYE